MEVIIYSTASCPYCKMLKDYLREKQISFVEKLVDNDAVAREEMAKESGGFLGVPFVVISKEGNKETVVGFDKNKIDGILGLA